MTNNSASHTSRRSFLALMAGVPALGLVACAAPAGAAAGGSAAVAAPEIAYGFDLCDQCNLLITDARFSAATVMKDGHTRKFDNVVDMVAYHKDHPGEQPVAWFAHDYVSRAWVDAPKSSYAILAGVESCSLLQKDVYGFRDRQAAGGFADKKGARALSFDEMRAEVYKMDTSH